MKTYTNPKDFSKEIVAAFAELDGTWTGYETLEEIPANRLPFVVPDETQEDMVVQPDSFEILARLNKLTDSLVTKGVLTSQEATGVKDGDVKTEIAAEKQERSLLDKVKALVGL